MAAMASGGTSTTQLRRRTSVSLLSNEQVRASVVRELVQTERDFVKILRDVAEGYVAECRLRTDMFNEVQIETIFINLEDLLDFQSKFLKDLESSIDWNAPYKSCVGECFLNHVREGTRGGPPPFALERNFYLGISFNVESTYTRTNLYFVQFSVENVNACNIRRKGMKFYR